MTYAQLLARIADWIDRSNLSTQSATFVELAEERFNRTLRLNAFSSIDTVTVPTGQSSVALPADYVEGRALCADGDDWQQVTPEKLAQLRAQGSSSAYYSVIGSSLHIPYTATQDVPLELTYWTKVPALSDSATTNWLSINHPSVYLFTALAEAAVFVMSPEQSAAYEARAARAIAELQAADQAARYFAGSITAEFVV